MGKVCITDKITSTTDCDLKIRSRIAWAVIVLTATVTSIVLLYVSWHWNAETPTATVIESTHYAIWNVPFPAVTVCSMNKISKSGAKVLASRMIRPDNVTVDELSRMFSLTLNFHGIGKASKEEYDLFNDILLQNNVTIKDLTHDLVPSCSDLLERCMWKGTQTRCDTLFQRINTTEGVCCSFNYFGLTTNNFQV